MVEIKRFEPKKRLQLIQFNRYCISRNLSIARKIKLIRHIKILLKDNNLDNITKLKIYKLLEKIDTKDLMINTKRDYKIALRAFLKSIDTQQELINIIIPGSVDIKQPRQIIKDPNLWQNMKTKKEQLFVRLAKESGARPGELLNLRYDDIDSAYFGFIIHLNGKTGERPFPIIDSAKMLKEDMKQNPSHEEYVFNFSYDSIRRKVAIMLKNAGYTDTYMYLFRKTTSSEFFFKYPEQVVKRLLGWSKNSSMTKVYDCMPTQNAIDVVVQSNQSRGIPKKLQTNLNNWGA